MREMKLIAMLLAAIKAGENNAAFNISLIDPAVLNTDEKTRDRIAVLLQDEGYIKGLLVIDGIDNMQESIIRWGESKPSITLKGYEYIATNDALRSTLKELKKASLGIAATLVNNAVCNMIK